MIEMHLEPRTEMYLAYQDPDGTQGKLVFDNEEDLVRCLQTLTSAFREGRGVWWGVRHPQLSDMLVKLIYFSPSSVLQAHFPGVSDYVLELLG